MTYYQIGALVFSAICLLFALISYITYLLTSHKPHTRYQQQHHPFLKGVHKGAYLAIFGWLGGIPIVCQALGVLSLLEGIVATLAVYLVGLYLKKGISQQQRSRTA